MLIFLPKNNDLASIERSLSSAQLAQIQRSLFPQQVEVSLPKFTFSTSYDLNDTLSTMGMSSAFDPNTADFSGMDGQKDLYIGLVIHKAYIAVDEQGTEAAAATGIGMTLSAANVVEQQPIIFRADHPFLFMILDNTTGSILFFGRVDDPTAQ
jgi:serpin B